MGKIIKSSLLVIVLSLIIMLAGCRLKSLPLNEAKSILEEKGYAVRVVEGSEFTESSENKFNLFASELENYLEARKDDDVIYMYFFYFIDNASSNYQFMSEPNLRAGQLNELVYFGTKQAIKDAGL